jgi:hypothetical protein
MAKSCNIKESIFLKELKEPDDKPRGGSAKKNTDQLILDTICPSADNCYSTELSLPNDDREKSKVIIDALYEPFG